MSKNKLFRFEVEMEAKNGTTYRTSISCTSMHLNGAVRKLYQTMPDNFRGIKRIL